MAHEQPVPTRHEARQLELEDLFRAAFPPLVRALSLLCDDPADVVQEAFLEAHRHWDTVAHYDDPAGWIRHVALNKARDRHRRRAVEHRLLGRAGRPPAAADDQTDTSFDVRTAIRRLPRRQQSAVTLFYVADLSVVQVAAAMGISVGAVKAALHAGRQRLARILEVPEDD